MITLPLSPEAAPAGAGTPAVYSALFTQLVTGHAQMALMFLGQVENPQTGRLEEVNTEAARIFIDQLEMLEAKTRGNLSPEESRLLTQNLNRTRRAFVASVDTQLAAPKGPPVTPPAAPDGGAQRS